MAKLISVVIPTFDRQTLTDRAVQSVMSGNPELVEIVVVDDCGEDPYAFPQAANQSDIPVRVIRLEINEGPGGARAAGIRGASADFIAFLDSDDEYTPGWLDWVTELLQSRDPADKGRLLICGIAHGEKTAGRKVKNFLRNTGDTASLAVGRIITSFFNPFVTPSLVMSRDICGFSSELRYCEDFYAVSVAVHNADQLVVSPAVACQLNRRPNSIGGLSGHRMRMFMGELRARRALLLSHRIRFPYKGFVLMGFPYQCARVLAKYLLDYLPWTRRPRALIED